MSHCGRACLYVCMLSICTISRGWSCPGISPFTHSIFTSWISLPHYLCPQWCQQKCPNTQRYGTRPCQPSLEGSASSKSTFLAGEKSDVAEPCLLVSYLWAVSDGIDWTVGMGLYFDDGMAEFFAIFWLSSGAQDWRAPVRPREHDWRVCRGGGRLHLELFVRDHRSK